MTPTMPDRAHDVDPGSGTRPDSRSIPTASALTKLPQDPPVPLDAARLRELGEAIAHAIVELSEAAEACGRAEERYLSTPAEQRDEAAHRAAREAWCAAYTALESTLLSRLAQSEGEATALRQAFVAGAQTVNADGPRWTREAIERTADAYLRASTPTTCGVWSSNNRLQACQLTPGHAGDHRWQQPGGETVVTWPSASTPTTEPTDG
jgi:hypothetical protein